MSSLFALQECFQAFILNGNRQIFSSLSGRNNRFMEERLDIYKAGYYLQLQAILAMNYPGLEGIAGKKLFAQMIEDYTLHYPPTHFSGYRYGDQLSTFLQVTSPYCKTPVLAEAAKFIWALNLAISAPESGILKQEVLAAVPQESWPTMRFELHPSVFLLEFTYNVVEVWEAINKGLSLPVIKQATVSSHWLIWRKEFRSCYRKCSINELKVIKYLSQQASFSDICEGLCESLAEDQVPQEAVTLLLRCLQEGMLAKVIF